MDEKSRRFVSQLIVRGSVCGGDDDADPTTTIATDIGTIQYKNLHPISSKRPKVTCFINYPKLE